MGDGEDSLVIRVLVVIYWRFVVVVVVVIDHIG
jgi:hypothetical protein